MAKGRQGGGGGPAKKKPRLMDAVVSTPTRSKITGTTLVSSRPPKAGTNMSPAQVMVGLRGTPNDHSKLFLKKYKTQVEKLITSMVAK